MQDITVTSDEKLREGSPIVANDSNKAKMKGAGFRNLLAKIKALPSKIKSANIMREEQKIASLEAKAGKLQEALDFDPVNKKLMYKLDKLAAKLNDLKTSCYEKATSSSNRIKVNAQAARILSKWSEVYSDYKVEETNELKELDALSEAMAQPIDTPNEIELPGIPVEEVHNEPVVEETTNDLYAQPIVDNMNEYPSVNDNFSVNETDLFNIIDKQLEMDDNNLNKVEEPTPVVPAFENEEFKEEEKPVYRVKPVRINRNEYNDFNTKSEEEKTPVKVTPVKIYSKENGAIENSDNIEELKKQILMMRQLAAEKINKSVEAKSVADSAVKESNSIRADVERARQELEQERQEMRAALLKQKEELASVLSSAQNDIKSANSTVAQEEQRKQDLLAEQTRIQKERQSLAELRAQISNSQTDTFNPTGFSR